MVPTIMSGSGGIPSTGDGTKGFLNQVMKSLKVKMGRRKCLSRGCLNCADLQMPSQNKVIKEFPNFFTTIRCVKHLDFCCVIFLPKTQVYSKKKTNPGSQPFCPEWKPVTCPENFSDVSKIARIWATYYP